MMKTPVHPGEILREDVLAELGLGVGEAASRLGISRVALSRVLHGHARISPNLAVRLEEAGVGTARASMRHFVPARTAIRRAPQASSIASRLPWLKPVESANPWISCSWRRRATGTPAAASLRA